MKPTYFFTISRRDRISIVVFIFLLLAWELVKLCMPSPILQKQITAYQAEEMPLAIQDNQPRKKFVKPLRTRSVAPSKSDLEEQLPSKTGTTVEIMNASMEELTAIGFKKNTARNITKYKDAGGMLKDKESVMRIYGMDSNQWNKVSDYVIFPERTEESYANQPYDPNRYLPKRIIDLNTATIVDLDSLPGIGPVFAERIVNYRTSLGGFLHIHQIESCYGIPPETVEQILPFVAIVTPMKPKSIQDIDWSTYHHPYLPQKFRPMILSYQKHHGPLKSESDLRNVFPPDTGWCDQWLPYLTFDSAE